MLALCIQQNHHRVIMHILSDGFYVLLTFIPPIVHSFSTFLGSYLSLQCDWIEDVLA